MNTFKMSALAAAGLFSVMLSLRVKGRDERRAHAGVTRALKASCGAGNGQDGSPNFKDGEIILSAEEHAIARRALDYVDEVGMNGNFVEMVTTAHEAVNSRVQEVPPAQNPDAPVPLLEHAPV